MPVRYSIWTIFTWLYLIGDVNKNQGSWKKWKETEIITDTKEIVQLIENLISWKGYGVQEKQIKYMTIRAKENYRKVKCIVPVGCVGQSLT